MRRVPTEIRRVEEKGLEISWSDGSKQSLSSRTLRTNCPCASCREQRGDESHAAPLTAKKGLLKIIEATSEESLRLLKVWAIGNYAIGIEWGDRHNAGIYTFDYLASLHD